MSSRPIGRDLRTRMLPGGLPKMKSVKALLVRSKRARRRISNLGGGVMAGVGGGDDLFPVM